jgi:hypothetical protein
MLVILILGRLRQEDLKFKATWAIQRDLLSKNPMKHYIMITA